MDETPPPRPALTAPALAEKQARDARAAAALRANLQRRKQQQRARASDGAGDVGTASPGHQRDTD